MDLVFPNWSTDPSVVQKVIADEEHDASYYLVSPIKVIDFDRNHSVLLTFNAEYSDFKNSVGGYQQSYYVGAYFFLRTNKKLILVKRSDTATNFLGPRTAKETLQKWAGGGYILTVTSGGCWQGACSDQIDLLQVTENETKPLSQESIPVRSDNLYESVERFEGDDKGIICDRFLHMSSKQFYNNFNVYPGEDNITIECGFSSSKRRFDKNHLYLEITNVHKRIQKNGRPGKKVRKVNSVIYELSSPEGTFKIKSGENTVRGY